MRCLHSRPHACCTRHKNQLGADVAVNVKGLSPAEAADKVVGDGGRRPDACVDCCGFESSVATALAAAKSGGKVCLVGMVRFCIGHRPRDTVCVDYVPQRLGVGGVVVGVAVVMATAKAAVEIAGAVCRCEVCFFIVFGVI